MTSAASPALTRQFDARVARAENLAVRYPFSAEVLRFYARIAQFQQTLLASFPSLMVSPDALRTRAFPDLSALPPRFHEFLALVEKAAPHKLAAAAHELAKLPPDSWKEIFVSFWQVAGRRDHQIGALAQFFPRAFLQTFAEALTTAEPAAPPATNIAHCPFCYSRPLLGVLRPEGDGAKRFLLCSFCHREWEFRRILCPTCGEVDEPKLPVYVAETLPHIRVECCETCHFYLRAIDLTKDGHAVPLVDDLAALPLTLWAQEHHYFRTQPNLLGT